MHQHQRGAVGMPAVIGDVVALHATHDACLHHFAGPVALSHVRGEDQRNRDPRRCRSGAGEAVRSPGRGCGEPARIPGLSATSPREGRGPVLRGHPVESEEAFQAWATGPAVEAHAGQQAKPVATGAHLLEFEVVLDVTGAAAKA